MSRSYVCQAIRCHLLQEAAEFVTGLQSVLEQFAHAMLHIGQRYTLQETSEILAIAQGPLSQGRDPWQRAQQSSGPEGETVVARAPGWGTDHSMPPSWSALAVNVHSIDEFYTLEFSSLINGGRPAIVCAVAAFHAMRVSWSHGLT